MSFMHRLGIWFAPAARIAGLVGLVITGAAQGGCSFLSPGAGPFELHVAPWGDDRNPGTQSRPLATLTGARDAVRAWRKSKGSPVSGATVYLHKGVYAVRSTIEFDGRDSGLPESPMTWRPWRQDEVRIIGGVEVDGSLFGPVDDDETRVRLLPQVRDRVRRLNLKALGIEDYGEIGPRGFRRPYRPAPLEVFVNGEAMHIARWPNPGEDPVPIGEVLDEGSVPRTGDFSNRGGVFRFDADRPKRWTSARDVWISGLFAAGYADDTVKVAEFDLDDKTIHTVQPTLYGFKTGAHWRAWYALNLLEEIDEPGEYYVDTEKGWLYLYPPAPLQNARIQISLLEEPVFALEGASHLKFENLIVECSRGTGFYIERGAGNVIAGCTLRNLGILAVQMGKGVEDFKDYAVYGTGKPVSRRLGSWHEHVWFNNDFLSEAGTSHTILSCDIYNTGAGGVHINGGNRVTLEPGGNQIVNCDLHHGNRLERSYKAPINIDGVANRIAHCRIHDAPNQAIYLQGNDQIIEYNEICRTATHVDDGAPLYTGMDPTQLGTQIRYNYWHHNGSAQMSGQRGALIYFDCPGGQNAIIHGNVFHRNHAAWGQVFINVGDTFFEIENNLFIDVPLAMRIEPARDEAHWFEECDIRNRGERAVLVEKIDFTSPPYSERYPEYVNYGKKGWYSRDNNLVRRNVAYKCGEFLQGAAMCENNLETDKDPGFVDAAAGDFRLRPDASVFAEIPGFEPIPFERMGLCTDEYRESIQPLAPSPPEFRMGPAEFVGETAVAFRDPDFPDTRIRYTLDGADPTSESALYTGPFAIEESTAVSARAFREGAASDPVRQTFTRIGSASGPAKGENVMNADSIVWDSPSKDSTGSMPIGNGEIGANVWVEESGDLLFYLSRTDAWSENCRLLKLGRIRVALEPNPLQEGDAFTQTLDLERGEILVRFQGDANDVSIRFLIDANHPVVSIDIKSDRPLQASVSLEHWRTARRELTGSDVYSAYGLHGEGGEPIFVEPDTILTGPEDRVVWYHRNERSIWKANMELQALGEVAAKQTDPLLHRTFGALIEGEGLVRCSEVTLQSAEPARRIHVAVCPHTNQTETADEWLREVNENARRIAALPRDERVAAHRAWWAAFWDRSHIWVSTETDADREVVGKINQGYVMQRFMNACAGRGSFPIKFNGSIFTTEAEDEGPRDADFRRWGGPYWWQNTRLPYWAMLESGDLDLMPPLFDMFRRNLESRQAATRIYYDHEGAFYPETHYFWGAYVDANYGRDRSELPEGMTQNRFIRYYWQGGLELSLIMLDYYAFTGDDAFAWETLLPVASEILTFFDQHWERDANGQIRFDPAMALETYREAVNPLVEIVGIRKVCEGMLALPESLTTPEQREQWRRLISELPPVPTREVDGETLLACAESYSGKQNIENPELYAIFPYRRYGLGKPGLDLARRTFDQRLVRQTGGWQQNAIKAAYLGLADEAATMMGQNFSTKSAQHRFPAMWGPNYDWIPDQCHGGVAMAALQRMLLQYEGDELLVLPAWPRRWDVDFKLHAPDETTVEGRVRGGEIERLTVSPSSRAGDVVLGEGWSPAKTKRVDPASKR